MFEIEIISGTLFEIWINAYELIKNVSIKQIKNCLLYIQRKYSIKDLNSLCFD